MRKQAAIELSANFMVVLIIGIVVFSMGIGLAYSMLSKAEEVSDKIDEQTQNDIWNLLDTGNPVVAPINTATVLRGKTAVFGIGVRNIEFQSNFRLIITKVNFEGCDANSLKVVTSLKPRLIKENGETIFTAGVGVPKNAKACDYILNAEIKRCSESAVSPDCEPDETYSLVQKLYVTVP